MKVFTYYDYIKCIHSIRLNKRQGLSDEKVKYEIDNKKEESTNNEHDKLIKTILKNKEEMAKLINNFLKPNKKVDSKNLVKYTNSYITKKYMASKADIVYKLKDDEIYFLIEHQSKKDNKMPERILNYSVDIIHEWSKEKNIKKKTKYPIIVPIVIYTGDGKWNIPKNFKDVQIENNEYLNNRINIEYNLIDINKISVSKLLNQKSLFGYAMILEKAKDKKELQESFNLVINSDNSHKYLEELQDIVIYLLKGISKELKENFLMQLKEKIEKEGGKMSNVSERLRKEFKNDVKKALQEEGTDGVVKVMEDRANFILRMLNMLDDFNKKAKNDKNKRM